LEVSGVLDDDRARRCEDHIFGGNVVAVVIPWWRDFCGAGNYRVTGRLITGNYVVVVAIPSFWQLLGAGCSVVAVLVTFTVRDIRRHLHPNRFTPL
jgi:hypothetical protein